MPNLNGRIEIRVINGRVDLETSIDPAMVCHILLKVLSSVYEKRVLKTRSEVQVWTPDH